MTHPLVSIVIPTHGAWEWTSRALEALSECTDLPHEVIVCDNDSRDETLERLRALVDVKVHFNAENLGFGTACNQGATRARAPYLVFLNSDAVVRENWLPPLLAAMERNRAVGAVGPRLLNADGSLQEAGASVLSDGVTIKHGGGSAPTGPEYGFQRAVDYVSGACLATRRATFHEVGGFDAAFGLGYFEDVDFCLRLRSVGYRVLYEPDSVVMHAGGASSADQFKQELAGRNHRLFFARWRHAFAGGVSLSDSEGVPQTRLRDVSAVARILVLAGPDQDACRDLLDELAESLSGANVTLLGQMRDAPRTIEVVAEDDVASWLRQRRFHYDVVWMLERPAAEMKAALEESQPQALHVVRLEGVGDRRAAWGVLGPAHEESWLSSDVFEHVRRHASVRSALAEAGVAVEESGAPRGPGRGCMATRGPVRTAAD